MFSIQSSSVIYKNYRRNHGNSGSKEKLETENRAPTVETKNEGACTESTVKSTDGGTSIAAERRYSGLPPENRTTFNARLL